MSRSTARWPISLRPEPGELLYSWTARIGAIYQLGPSELFLPDFQHFDHDSLFRLADSAVLHWLHSRCGIPVRALVRMTFAGALPLDQPEWWTGSLASIGFALPQHPQFSRPVIHVCPFCLRDDLKNGSQFIRLIWQNVAATVCQTHRVPIQRACIACGTNELLVCQYFSDRHLQFLCSRVNCCAAQERGGWIDKHPPAKALAALLAFERFLLQGALQCKPVDSWWVGPASPTQLLRLLVGLSWAFTRSHCYTRPLYRLQTPSFALGAERVSDAASRHWRFASPALRRSILAAILALTSNDEIRATRNCSKTGPCFATLLTLLSYPDQFELYGRSKFWPPAVSATFRPAFRSPRVRRRLLRQTPSFRTI